MDLVVESLKPSAVLYLVGVWVGYQVLLALYNISPFHPLYRFPGPKIAAVSYLYEAWYDWILVGRYGRKIKEMHDRYGPIVRINPDELHCADPCFLDEIYTGPGRVRDKWQHQLNTGAVGPVAVTGFSTVSHDLHRLRKAPFSRYFLDIWDRHFDHRVRNIFGRRRGKKLPTDFEYDSSKAYSTDSINDDPENLKQPISVRARKIGFGLAAAAMLPAIFVQVPSGLAVSGSLLSGVTSADKITRNETTLANGTIIAGNITTTSGDTDLNSTAFNVLFSVIQVAISISVGLSLSALIVYPFGKRRSGLFSF